VTWTAIGNTTVDGALTAELGVAVTSHDPAQLNMAVVDRVLIRRQP
jgi:hypothetical protein